MVAGLCFGSSGIGSCSGGKKTSLAVSIQNDNTFKEIVTNTLTIGAQTITNNSLYNIATVELNPKDLCCPNCTPEQMAQLPPVCGGNLNISQRNSSNVKVASQVSTTDFETMLNNLNNSLQTGIQQGLDSSTQPDIFSAIQELVGGKTSKDISTNIVNNFTTQITKNFNRDIVNKIITNTIQKNTLSLKACGPVSTGDCNITQENFLNIQVSNVLNAYASAIENTSTYTDIKNTVSQKEKDEQKSSIVGIFSAIGDMIKSLGIIWVSVIAVVIFFVMIIVLVGMYLLLKNPDSATKLAQIPQMYPQMLSPVQIPRMSPMQTQVQSPVMYTPQSSFMYTPQSTPMYTPRSI
jgi:hypothetical protein